MPVDTIKGSLKEKGVRLTRQRQLLLELIDKSGESGPIARPFQHPLCRRHKGEAALSLLAKETEIGSSVAYSDDAHPARIRKAPANAAADETSRDDPEAHGVEIAQIDNINRHGTKLA